MNKRYLITVPPPTPNGDLHIGHLSGPFLAADVLSRIFKLNNKQYQYPFSTDSFQSYVTFKAFQLGKSPKQVSVDNTNNILNTLQKLNVHLDFYNPFRIEHQKYTQKLFVDLYEKGVFIKKTIKINHCEQCNQYLYEAYVIGECPHCAHQCGGSYCEKCGLPNDSETLQYPKCKKCGRDAQLKELDVIVFPIEKYKPFLKNFYRKYNYLWRKNTQNYTKEIINKHLNDIILTNMNDWGINVPIRGFEGQVINAWFEILPGHINNSDSQDSLWNKESNSETNIIQFFGFDNIFYYLVMYPALLHAMNNKIIPKYFYSNEFYLINGDKFSTSRGNAIWGKDFIDEYTCDFVRYYLSLTSPETQQTSYQPKEVAKEYENFKELNMLISTIESLNREITEPIALLLETYTERFYQAFQLEVFSLKTIATLIKEFITEIKT
ncbi:Methionine--tRNA ligase [Bacillus velezensis]|nr:Methionine--tRNA ligase [Bacillus velezensis]